ncbi:Glyceraldehyde-3-phosphate dehydrogenase [Galemys pyrenaicus]|uniref:Glyceraldehyde-3-phosphate dehydrogenase n=1 Tax=Galemys pyrenaicus TaxID=202257 RepID=A0A8J6DKM3_GALPY|nr:Glyceraldehyde-3-phosphate dehydrogenase [Galemys pyrenaicus]
MRWMALPGSCGVTAQRLPRTLSTGTAKAVGKVLPGLHRNFTNMTFCIPPCLSAADLTCHLPPGKAARYDDIKEGGKQTPQGSAKDIQGYKEDLSSHTHSATFMLGLALPSTTALSSSCPGVTMNLVHMTCKTKYPWAAHPRESTKGREALSYWGPSPTHPTH